MARSFASASSDYAENGAAVITGYPCTLFGWFQVTDRTVGQALMAVGAGGGTTRVQLSNNNSGIGAGTSVTAAGGTSNRSDEASQLRSAPAA